MYFNSDLQIGEELDGLVVVCLSQHGIVICVKYLPVITQCQIPSCDNTRQSELDANALLSKKISLSPQPPIDLCFAMES